MGGADGIRSTNPALPVVTTQTLAGAPPAAPANEVSPQVPADVFARETPEPRRPLLTGEASSSASVEIGPDGASLEAEAGLEIRGPRGFGVQFGASAAAEVRSDVAHGEDGFTTYTVTRELSVTVSGAVEAGVLGFGAEHTEGVEATYQVRMPTAQYAAMEAGQIPAPDPFHPETMPEGTSIVMSSTDYQNSGFSASFRQIGLQSKVRTEEGTSVVIEARPGNQIAVTAGPTAAVENSWQLGLDLGLASVHIGNSTELSNFSFNTATYDLDSAEGAAAYNEFLVTGGFPEDNGAGVTDVARIEKIDYSSTSSIGGAIGPFEASVDFASDSVTQVRTTFPDGTGTVVSDFDLHIGVPVHLEQTFNADGAEELSQQRFTMTLPDVHDETGAHLYQAFTGTPWNMEQFAGERGVELTLTAEEAQALSERAKAYVEGYEAMTGGMRWDPSTSPFLSFIDSLANAENAAEAAYAFATGLTAGPLAEDLNSFAMQTGGALPGTIQVN